MNEEREINTNDNNELGNKLEKIVQEYDNNSSWSNVNTSQRLETLPEDPKEKAFVFLDKGMERINDTLNYNKRVSWTQTESEIMYGTENSIMTKSMELQELINSLKQEKQTTDVDRKLIESSIDWLEVEKIENGLFQLKDKNSGKIIATNNAEVTIRLIDGFSKIKR